MSETFVRLKPARAVARGRHQGVADRGDARVARPRSPACASTSRSRSRTTSRRRCSGVRGQVVLKIFGTDLDACARRWSARSEVLAAVPGIVDLDLYRDTTVPQLQIELDREALARAGIIDARTRSARFETALRRHASSTSFWRRGAPRAGARAPAARRSAPTRAASATLLVPTPDGGAPAAARARPHRRRRRAARRSTARQQPHHGAEVQRRRAATWAP